MNGNDPQILDLLSAMKMTAGARFNAGKRLERHDRLLTLLAAVASVSVIALTILPYFVLLPKEVADHLNLLTVWMSVVVLVSSLLQYSNSYTVRAEQHHRSALEINELRRDLKAIQSRITGEEFLDLSRKYSGVLQKYSINHDDVDYERHQLQRPEEFGYLTKYRKMGMQARQIIARQAPNFWLCVVIMITFFAIFLYALPAALPKQ